MLTRSDTATAAALAAPTSEFLQGRTIVLLALLGMSTSVSALLLYSFGAMVVPLQQVILPAYGAYSVEVLIDGQHKRSLGVLAAPPREGGDRRKKGRTGGGFEE